MRAINNIFGAIIIGLAVFFDIAAARIWGNDETWVRMFMTFTVICAIFGIPALVGGICALIKQKWILALLGSIFAIPLLGAGIISLVFVAMSKNEFK
ncbi:MAG: hypothetical protein PHU08_01905 [Dehalococcoidales bacterium]|nr:hypothetical protein [Dehalococcoidales bacterium]